MVEQQCSVDQTIQFNGNLIWCLQEWQSPVSPAGLADPEVDRYQPGSFSQDDPYAYPGQSAMTDYMAGAKEPCALAVQTAELDLLS